METDSGNNGNNNGCAPMHGERILRERGYERWIVGEDHAWFVHLEEGQRSTLREEKRRLKVRR
jgi:hypothetical protein